MTFNEFKNWLDNVKKEAEYAKDYDMERSMGNYDDVFSDGRDLGYYEAIEEVIIKASTVD